ncbi:MAG: type II CAAX prenyl endopeptidase Rce1 family protein [Promethearchaeota archaeon]
MMKNIIKKYPLISYFIIAWISTWILVLPLILTNFGLLSVDMNWHFLGALGPTISAIIVVYITAKKQGLKELKNTSFKWRIGAFWILFSALIMPFFLLLAILLNFFFTGNFIDLIGYLIDNGISSPLTFFIWIWVGAIAYGLFEEIGWRGYALPKLQEKYNSLIATIILTIGWAFWHFPMFLYHFSVDMLFGWLYSLFMGSIIVTFLFNSSGGSAFATILFHITNNLVWLFNIAELQIYLTIMITIFAFIILVVWRTRVSTRKDILKK